MDRRESGGAVAGFGDLLEPMDSLEDADHNIEALFNNEEIEFKRSPVERKNR